jgi:isopenicillin N synthase-like dioxygenase
VLAGYHTDLNALTVHGASRFPGLYVWTREGRRVAVRGIPPGCLLVQAGKQLEYATAGHALAGFHEVVVDGHTEAAVAAARAAGRSLWRISSTVFLHFASDATLAPLGDFARAPGAAEAYPPVLVGQQVAAELRAIALSSDHAGGDDDEVIAAM